MSGSLHSGATGSVEEFLAQTGWVRELVRHLLGSTRHPDEDDLVQDTMIRAISAAPDTDQPVRGWLATVARRLLWERHRRATRRARHEARAAAPAALPTPAELAHLAETQRIVVEAAVALPEPYRHVVLLRYLHDTSAREIAAELGVPIETVRSYIKRGLALLRKRLRSTFGERNEDWAAALLPLAFLPPKLVPPGAPGRPAPAAAHGLPRIAAVAVLVIVAAALWVWSGLPGAGNARKGGKEPAAVSEPLAAATPRAPRRRHTGAAIPSAGARRAATERSAAADEPPARPDAPPPGGIRVLIEGLPAGLTPPARLHIRPFLPSAQRMLEGGYPEAVTVDVDGPQTDIDLAALVPGLDVIDADVTLDHPALRLVSSRAAATAPGDPGLPARLVAIPAAFVSGRVLDTAGVPLPGAIVLAGLDPSEDERLVADETVSDAQGRFRLRVPPGEMVRVIARVPAGAAGWATVRSTGPGEAASVDVHTEEGTTISGRVLVAPGVDASGLRVVAGVEHNEHRGYAGPRTTILFEDGRVLPNSPGCRVAADGTFVLTWLPPWDYTVGIDEPFVPGAHRGVDSVRVIRAAPSAGVVLDRRLIDVPFLVMDDDGPRSGVMVTTWNADFGGLCAAESDEDGRLVLAMQPGIEYRYTARLSGSSDFREGRGTVPESGPAAEVRIEMGARVDATWTVRLTYPSGEPITRAAFQVVPAEGVRFPPAGTEMWAADGVYTLTGLGRGPQHAVIRVGSAWGDVRQYWYDIETDVSLPESGPLPTLSPTGKGGRLRIRLVNAAGPASGVRGALFRDGRPVPCWFSARQTTAGRGSPQQTLWGMGPNDVVPALPPGAYELVLSRSQQPDVRRKVTVRAEQVTDVVVELPPR